MSSTSLAQTSTASISGHVVDSAGAPLPGVTITAKAGDQQDSVTVGTDGMFALTGLRPGTYTVTAPLPGFATERRRIEVSADGTSVVDFSLRLGCLVGAITITDHQPLVDPSIPPRSDLVAYVRIDEREEAASDPDCRTRYRARILRSVSRRSYTGATGGAVVLLNEWPTIEPGKEYIIWLAWRPDKNAFDSGSDDETLVRPVEAGRVNTHSGPCVQIQNPPPNYCPQTYSVEELFKIFEGLFGR
jgi:Carboxypeptidase regulatory-like domain